MGDSPDETLAALESDLERLKINTINDVMKTAPAPPRSQRIRRAGPLRKRIEKDDAGANCRGMPHGQSRCFTREGKMSLDFTLNCSRTIRGFSVIEKNVSEYHQLVDKLEKANIQHAHRDELLADARAIVVETIEETRRTQLAQVEAEIADLEKVYRAKMENGPDAAKRAGEDKLDYSTKTDKELTILRARTRRGT